MVFSRQKTTESRVETILEFPSVRRAQDLQLFMFAILREAAETSNRRKFRICTFLQICTLPLKSAHLLKNVQIFEKCADLKTITFSWPAEKGA
jgi:hypothetical protein